MRKRFLSSIAIASVLVLSMSAATFGASNNKTVQILDNCDPVSFNAALGDGSCVRNGGMSFDTFLSKIPKGGAQSWRFSPGQVKVPAGGTVTAINRGGEAHTFTEVAAFGGGCIAELNGAVGAGPVAECAGFPGGAFGATLVFPGASLTTDPLGTGTYFFQCLIHPWQRTTVTVR